MPFYRKKAVLVQAVQWDGDNLSDMKWFLGDDLAGYDPELEELWVSTLEDGVGQVVKHIASKGDFIIRGVNGEHYACKPDIFEKTYEREPDGAHG